MEIRKLNLNKDYDQICNLWDSYDLPNLDLELASPFGTVAVINDKIIGAFFIYLSYGVPTAMIRFPVLDKQIDKDIVFKNMIEFTHIELKKLGYKYVLCSTPHKGLINKLKNNNYIETFLNCSHLEGVL